MSVIYAPTGQPNDLLGAPMVPSAEWFDTIPENWAPWVNADDPVIYVGTDGRFAAMVAPYGVCLLEAARFKGECWTAPLSQTEYAWAHAGKVTPVIEADGSTGQRPTANIAGDLAHAKRGDTVKSRRAAFDDTSKMLARGTYFDRPDLGCILILGALVPTVTKWQGLKMQASGLSGEWMPLDQFPELEMIGSILVLEQGFRREVFTPRNAMFQVASVGGMMVGSWTPRKIKVTRKVESEVALKAAAANSAVPSDLPTGTVLVALPAADQWTDSIEEAHCTICYVPNAGDDFASGVMNKFARGLLMDFASTTASAARPFMAKVAATGMIGPEGAAAVLFNCGDLANLNVLATAVLQSAISTYEPTYPNYLPHLTTGYGTDPIPHECGKEVVFDRLALWSPDGKFEYPFSVAPAVIDGPLSAAPCAPRKKIRVQKQGGPRG